MSEKEKILKGALLMTAGFFFLALTSAFFKAATTKVSSFWAIWCVYSTACLILLGTLGKKGLSLLKTKRLGGHFGRVFFGLTATIFFVITLHLVSLLNATLFLNTFPLFIPIFSLWFLKTKTELKTWIFLLLGFMGVLFLLGPKTSSAQTLGYLLGLGAGICQALAFIFVKMLTATEPARRINFYFFFLSSLFLTPYVVWNWVTPPFAIWLYLICGGICSYLSQLLIVKGYQYADASHIGPFQYTAVFFSGLIGWLFWQQTPTLFDLLGALCIISGGVFTLIFYSKPQPGK